MDSKIKYNLNSSRRYGWKSDWFGADDFDEKLVEKIMEKPILTIMSLLASISSTMANSSRLSGIKLLLGTSRVVFG